MKFIKTADVGQTYINLDTVESLTVTKTYNGYGVYAITASARYLLIEVTKNLINYPSDANYKERRLIDKREEQNTITKAQAWLDNLVAKLNGDNDNG